ncbi:hypothetical protein X737_38840 [Mesorhizobium sp. L48C026A00]|nr:hypothetical protein X737_38840 [Mesorhizobium sp. L48C026A00]
MIWPSACPLLQGSSMELSTASVSLRKTRANRMIGMSSESIASSIHASSGADLLPRRNAVEAHRQAAHLCESIRSLLQGIDPSCLPVCQQAMRLMHSAAATTGEIA